MISVCINVDTRPQNDKFGGANLLGCVNEDFLIDGVINKRKFFSGFDCEFIIHVDRHNDLSDEVLSKMHDLSDTLIIRKHTNETSFNDWSYYRCLSLANRDIVCHFDQDTACFRNDIDYVKELLALTESHAFVSYPSHWTPNPVVDNSFQGKFWASTRFFMCKRENLKLGELAKCIENPDWVYEKYGDSPRRLNWTEHFLAKINGHDVFYPPVELHKGAVFSWGTYKTGTLEALNNAPYEGVKQWILHNGGIVYPADVHVK